MRLSQGPSPCLITKLLELFRGGADKGDAGGIASRGEIMALTQESVPGVYGIGVCCNSCCNDGIDV